MTEVITGLVKLAFGFIRTYGAEKLQDGDLTDQKFRGWIVQKLDDIDFKLDGLCRKDLCVSISCLRQGMTRLIMSFDESTESENPSTSELPKDGKQSQDTTNAGASSTQTKPAQTSVEDAVSLADAVQKLKVVSNKRFELAKELLKEAGKKAREAFHNAALSTEDRILASKIRIASGILEQFDDPELAVSDCLQYLQELHDVPAIQEIFSVANKVGIKSWFKSGFKKDSRAEIVETVTTINLILAGFISKYTKQRMAVLDWPMIECGTRLVHPIHGHCDLPNLTRKMEITPPWDIVDNDLEENEALPFTHALKKRGALAVCYTRCSLGPQVKLDKTTGKLQPYCRSGGRSHWKPDDYTRNLDPRSVVDIAVDEDGTAYVLWGEEKVGFMLSTYTAVDTHHFSLKFITIMRIFACSAIAVTKYKRIVICQTACFGEFKIYLCYTWGTLINSFAFDTRQISDLKFVSVSCDDEIIIATETMSLFFKNSYVASIFTENGELQRTVKFRPSEGLEDSWNISYNKVTKSFIVCARAYLNEKIFIEYFSDQTGKLQRSYVLYQTNMPKEIQSFNLVCHPNGALALVDNPPNYHRFHP